MLAKLRMAQRRRLHPHLQLIGLSATLPNLNQVAAWLGAHLYVTDFRPVRLALCVCNGRRVERLVPEEGPGQGSGQWVHERDLPVSVQGDGETQALVQLCLEVVAVGSEGVLVFCMSRKWCEQSAARVSEAVAALQQGGHLSPPDAGARAGRQELLARLRLTSVGLAPELEHTIPQGVAFHHAGLCVEERALLEGAFKAGVLRVLVATSTLAAGVNLPARRVIVRSRKAFNGEDMSPAQVGQRRACVVACLALS
jgi:DNA polymerase theta